MFITKGENTIALDTISSFKCTHEYGMEGKQYCIIFEIKASGDRQYVDTYDRYGTTTKPLPLETVYFKYGSDVEARDAAYELLVDKYSIRL